MVAGLLAREGFDAVTLDMQHGFIDFGVAMRAIPLIVAAGKPGIVRIPVGEFATASRLLDAGATGIIAPMINTVEDARRLAAFTKFPPVGERSWGPAGALALTGLARPGVRGPRQRVRRVLRHARDAAGARERRRYLGRRRH
jgi:4-hydroxy-2-oxoheptanedioate aldolase